jgi:hypothetical protein
LIHEFVTVKTKDSKHLANKADLDRWLARISHGRLNTVADDSMVGPIEIPGTPLLSGPAKLYVAKAVVRRRVGPQG